MKLARRILMWLLIILLTIAGGTWIWLRSSVPALEGNLKMPGLSQPVSVHFDRYGIPHIEAAGKQDLYMAFGYIHARDRLFQMEMLRRAGGGELAEIFGKDLFPVDKMFRTIGISEYADQSDSILQTFRGQPMYNEILAYLAGINFFIDHGKMPPEFSIAGIPQRHFTSRDLFLAAGAMAFSFSQGQKTDFILEDIGNPLGTIYLEDLAVWHNPSESFIPSDQYPSVKKKDTTDDVPVGTGVSTGASLSRENLYELARSWDKISALLPFAPLQGSNAWVVSGKKTGSGKVIFCNDTHIGYLIP